MDYIEFLKKKIELAVDSGFEVDKARINQALKPHQADAVAWALKGGRRALFESFGLKNCVFKVSVDTKKWAKKAEVRAVKTVAQTAVATIGTATALGQVDAKLVVSASVLAGILSLLTSVAGLPEVEGE